MADARDALEKVLEGLDESSAFVTSGTVPPILPGLEVRGLGSIGVPIPAADAQRLITLAEQAPYGRGEETILDTNVRRVWQIDPRKFSLQNPEWEEHIQSIVETVKRAFGMPEKTRVKATLYKLLVYEKGSFFAPHRDTEKARNMFGTLVVCLPSKHKGGELIVRHDGEETTINFGGKASGFQTQFAAFYADCEHEVRPVTSGYRVGLVYNLAIAGKVQPQAPRSGPPATRAAKLLGKIFDDPSAEIEKLAIPFAHQYTEAGLDPRQLKGVDRTRAEILLRACADLGYECYFALMTHWQSGVPDYGSLDFDPYRRRNSYRWSYDDIDDEDEADNDDVEMEEVFDESLTLDHWLDAEGQVQPFGEIGLEDDEILGGEDREGWSRKQEVQEATGNAGVSMERWYRQGAIVVWPRDRKFSILASRGQTSALPELERMAARAKRPEALKDCREFAAAILRNWKLWTGRSPGTEGFPSRMLKVLGKIGDAKLAETFVRDILPNDFDGTEGPTLHAFCERWGWETFGPAIRDLVTSQKPDEYTARLGPMVSLCLDVCVEGGKAGNSARRTACSGIAEALRAAIERWDQKPAPRYGPSEDREGVLDAAFHILALHADAAARDGFVDHVLSHPQRYDLRRVLVPDLKAMDGWLPEVPAVAKAAARLLEHARSELREATASPVEPPKDWTREANLGCRCEDCKMLAAFLRDPNARVGRFPLRKERRQHLHQRLDQNQIDCTHVTERIGSPQTLVCTKTQASYERRLKQYQDDLKALGDLDKLGRPPKKAAAKPRAKAAPQAKAAKKKSPKR